MATVVGFVTQVAGVVRAVSADGTVRILVMGDPVHANETLETVGQNSSVNVLFEDGRQIAMRGEESSLLDDSVYSGQGYAESEVQAIQEALAQGQTLEEAAAGQEGPASDGGTGDVFVADRTGDLGDIGSYILGTDLAGGEVDEATEDGIVNVAPTVFDTSLSQNEVLDGQNVISGQLLVTDTNPNDTHTFFAVEGSLNVTTPDGVAIEGLTLVLNPDGSYTISGDFNALAAGENAVVTFEFFAVDNFDAASQVATFTLTITGTNDQPVVSDVNANGEGGGTGLVGYYDMNNGEGASAQTDSIETAGLTGLKLFTLSAEELSGIDTLYVQNPSNDNYGSEYLTQLDAITTAVSQGMTLIIHDRYVTNGAQILPGGESIIFHRLAGNLYDIDIADEGLKTGLGGAIDDTSLDGGGYSNHGYVELSSLPEGAVVLMTNGNPNQVVTFSYQYGSGTVIYSTIPLDYYLGNDYGTINTNMQIYAANLLEDMVRSGTAIYESADPQSGVEDVTTTFNGELPAVQDDDANDTHTYEVVGESLHVNNELVTNLTVVVNADGTYTIQGNFNALAAGETATVTFQYVANDGRGFDGTDGVNESSISEPATVTLTITGTNDRPVVADVSDTQDEALDGTNTFSGTLPEAQDADANDTHTYALVEESVDVSNELITDYEVVVNEDGTYSVVGDFNALAVGESATITFQYTATDSSSTQANGESNTSAPATVTLTVVGTNDAPIITDDSITTGTAVEAGNLDDGTVVPATPATGTMMATDVDNGAVLTWSGSTTGTYGSFEINEDTGVWTYVVDETPGSAADKLKEGQSVTETFTVTVTDEHGATDTRDVTITVLGTNDAPVAVADTNSVTEAGNGNFWGDIEPGNPFAIGGLLGNDYDVDGHANPILALDVVKVTSDLTGNSDTTTNFFGNLTLGGAYGSLVVNKATGAYMYTLSNGNGEVNALNEGETLTETFTYTIRDANGAIATSTLTITINGTNDAPVISGQTSGEASEAGVVTDGQGETTPVAAVQAMGTLVATDVDNESVEWSIQGDATGTYGSFAINQAGEWTYTVNPDVGSAADQLAQGEVRYETFTVVANDNQPGNPKTDTQTVTIKIVGTNDAPIITDDSDTTGTAVEAGIATDEGVTTPVAAVHATGTLVATDVDTGATLTWSGDDAGDYGSFMIDATTGKWTYTVDGTPGSLADQLAQGETKTETFTATVTDEHGATDTQTVTITITGTNDAPVAEVQDDLTAVEDGALITGQLVANDIDSDDDATTLTYTLVGDAPAGFVLNNDGSYSFDPSDEAYQSLGVTETADVTFTWIATDSHGASSAPQEVTITVTGTNDAPVATDDGKPTFSFGMLTGNYYAVDSDDNGLSGNTYVNNNSYLVDNLTEFKHIVATTDPAATFEATKVWYGYGSSNGVATGNSLQQFLGDDGASLEYTNGQTNTEEGGIHISGSVYIQAGTYNFKVYADDGYEILINGESVAKYDNNQSPTTRVHGEFTIDADGWYDIEMYWWDQGGEYVFKPEISADGGLTYTALSNEGTYVTPEDTAFTFQPEMLLANDFDIDGDTLTIISVSNAVNGTVELNEDGTITFTPAENFNGVATFDYTISDGNGGEDSATVTLHVSPVNDAPVALDDTLETSKDIPLTILAADLLANDSDVDGDTLSIISVGDAVNGTAVLNEDGTITFTPTGGFSGDATFTYTVSDGNGGTDTATVTITVDPGNSEPTITVTTGNPDNVNDTVSESGLATGSSPSGAAIVATGVFSIADADGLDDITSITLAGAEFSVSASDGFASLVGESVATQYGTVTVTTYNGNGNFSYTYELTDPASNDAPPAATHTSTQDSFTVVVSDGEASAEVTVTIDITDDTPQSFSTEATLSVAATEVLVGNFAAGWVNVQTTASNNKYTGTDLDSDSYHDKIEWGTPSAGGQASGYVFMDNEDLRANGGVEIDTEFTLGTFTHNNFTLTYNSPSLESADLEVKFMVTINGQSHLITHTIQFEHEETPNGGVDPQADADIVTIKNATFETEINGQTYTFSILGFVDGSGNLVTTVHTLENQANTYELVAKISSTDALPTVSDTVGHVEGDWGADGPADAQSITWASGENTIESGVVQGTYGTLAVDAQGNYTYTLDREVKDGLDANETITEEFTYYLTDSDGDRVASTLTVTINGQATLDAVDNLATTTINEVFVAPEATTEEVINEFRLQGTGNSTRTLTKTEQFSIEENATGELSFSVDVTAPGSTSATYHWTLFEIANGTKTTIDGSGTLNSDGTITVSGLDAGNYEISITIGTSGRYYDGFWPFGSYKYPSVEVSDVDLTAQPASYTEIQTAEASGNVLSDDVLGSVGTTLSIFTEGDFEAASASGTTVAGEFGTLTIFANGDYTYTPEASLDNVGQVESFTYQLTHPSGATDEATLDIRLDSTTLNVVWGSEGALVGTAGDDILVPTLESTLIDGGDGIDTLVLSEDIDLSNVRNIEILKLDTDTPISLSVEDVFNLTDDNNVLIVSGEGDVQITVDALENNDVWTKNDATSTPEQSVYEAVYNGSDITLIINQTVDTDIV
ncbi:MAG: tandem-95 repeat protein [Campylobacterales bacterium]|nr:tandem-95 repeat protein [Campylobacterales bacterium]